MVKRKIDAKIMADINNFIKALSKHYKIDAVYLFGSHANGNTHKWSDVDLAIVSHDIKDRIGDMAKMFVIASDFDALIEPHPINTDKFIENEAPLINEILHKGIRVA